MTRVQRFRLQAIVDQLAAIESRMISSDSKAREELAKSGRGVNACAFLAGWFGQELVDDAKALRVMIDYLRSSFHLPDVGAPQ